MRARVEGYELSYLRHGQGEPLLLIHGITTYSFMWEAMMPTLTKCYEAIAPDLLGCGESDKPEDVDYSPLAQARLMVGLLDVLNIHSVHVAAHDIGGAVGQLMAALWPERVKSLTLINTVGYDYWPVQPIVTFRIPILRHLAMAIMDIRLFRQVVLRALYHKEAATEALMEKLYRPFLTKEGRNGFLQLARCLSNYQLMGNLDAIHSIKVPVQIIRGDADVFLPPDIAERLHDNIPDSTLERVRTGGHYLQFDEPALLAKLIMDNAGKVKEQTVSA